MRDEVEDNWTLLKKHLAFTISYNDHKLSHQSVIEYLSNRNDFTVHDDPKEGDCSETELHRMIDSDTIFEIVAYPYSSVGNTYFCGSNLGEVMNRMILFHGIK